MISIEKVTLNVGVGGAGEKLEKAKKLLEKLSGQKPIETAATKRVPTWNIKQGMIIGTKVTLRGKKAADVLNRCLEAVENKIKASSFTDDGNFSFGVREYIDMPSMKYDPELGMFGFDVCITLRKWGYRVKKRKRAPAKIPKKHVITKAEAMDFAKKLGIEVVS
jgi:large subunit ribosomal protein L5